MSSNGIAIVGVGQTAYKKSRPELSAPELVFEAVERALADASAEPSDVDAVVFASAPEIFEGVHEPDRWCVDAFAGIDKPVLRVHTGGATGGSAAIVGAELIRSGRYKSVLIVGLQRVAEAVDAQQIFTNIFDPIFESDIQLNVITSVGIIASRQLAMGMLTEDDMAWVATKNFRAALSNQYAHIRRAVTADDVRSSRLLAHPIRLLHACPRSDGACAVLMVNRSEVRGRVAAHWRGSGSASDVYRLGDRMNDMGWDLGEPRGLYWAARKAYREAKVQDPANDIDVIEMYAPFSNLEIAFYSALGLVPRGEERQLVDEGATAPDGRIPVCPSGGTQASNPIGATGLVRVAEAAMQVMGRAEDHQVDGARTAVATATGGITQFFTVVVLGDNEI